MSKNKNKNNNGGGPVIINSNKTKETETQDMNLGEKSNAGKSQKELDEAFIKEQNEKAELDMEKLRAEMKKEAMVEAEVKLKKELDDQEERLKKLEESAKNPILEAAKASASEADLEAIFAQMERQKQAMVEKLKGPDADNVIDDTAERVIKSEKQSAETKYAPRKGVANFMMRQNVRYAVENKTEPYSADCVKNTLRKELGL